MKLLGVLLYFVLLSVFSLLWSIILLFFLDIIC